MLLSEMPPAVLSSITRLLEYETLLNLIHLSGDATLFRQCVTYGGVTELYIHTKVSFRLLTAPWRCMLPFQRVLALYIGNGFHHMQPLPPWSHRLPSTLESIHLNFEHSVEVFLRHVAASDDATTVACYASEGLILASLNERFPNLKTLECSVDEKKISRQAIVRFLDLLPASLTRFSFPVDYGVSVHMDSSLLQAYLKHMSGTLSLTCRSLAYLISPEQATNFSSTNSSDTLGKTEESTSKQPQESSISETVPLSCFQHLSVLRLLGIDNNPYLRLLSHLTHLEHLRLRFWRYAHHDYTFHAEFAPSLKVLSLIRLRTAHYAQALAKLPSGLRRLKLRLENNRKDEVVRIASLPKSLAFFSLDRQNAWKRMHVEICLTTLPENLGTLKISATLLPLDPGGTSPASSAQSPGELNVSGQNPDVPTQLSILNAPQPPQGVLDFSGLTRLHTLHFYSDALMVVKFPETSLVRLRWYTRGEMSVTRLQEVPPSVLAVQADVVIPADWLTPDLKSWTVESVTDMVHARMCPKVNRAWFVLNLMVEDALYVRLKTSSLTEISIFDALQKASTLRSQPLLEQLPDTLTRCEVFQCRENVHPQKLPTQLKFLDATYWHWAWPFSEPQPEDKNSDPLARLETQAPDSKHVVYEYDMKNKVARLDKTQVLHFDPAFRLPDSLTSLALGTISWAVSSPTGKIPNPDWRLAASLQLIHSGNNLTELTLGPSTSLSPHIETWLSVLPSSMTKLSLQGTSFSDHRTPEKHNNASLSWPKSLTHLSIPYGHFPLSAFGSIIKNLKYLRVAQLSVARSDIQGPFPKNVELFKACDSLHLLRRLFLPSALVYPASTIFSIWYDQDFAAYFPETLKTLTIEKMRPMSSFNLSLPVFPAGLTCLNLDTIVAVEEDLIAHLPQTLLSLQITMPYLAAVSGLLLPPRLTRLRLTFDGKFTEELAKTLMPTLTQLDLIAIDFEKEVFPALPKSLTALVLGPRMRNFILLETLTGLPPTLLRLELTDLMLVRPSTVEYSPVSKHLLAATMKERIPGLLSLFVLPSLHNQLERPDD